MALAEFIAEIEHKFKQDDPLVRVIKSPSRFIQALRDLDELVGMEKVKKSVVSQILFLLISIASGRPKHTHMLHTIIYGPPGVGKSRLGVCLAKVWLAIGIFQPSSMKPKAGRGEESTKNLLSALADKDARIIKLRRQSRDHLRLIRKCRLSATKIEQVRYRPNQSRYIDSIIRNLGYIADDLDDEIRQDELDQVNPDPDTDIPFVIASAPDLVAEYVGQSAIKTRLFFEQNRGGVIFIDEAYAIITEDRKSFGFESLTELNKCMSEYPDTIVQMAGYKDLIRKTIFDPNVGQPGLERRFAWVFDIPDYTPSDLEAIFRFQLKRDQWSIQPNLNLESFFKQHYNHFKAYGGDTEKLCFYSKQAYAEVLYQAGKTRDVTYDCVLTLPMLEIGIERLIENKAMPESTEISIPMGMYL